ncbi:NADP-dependent oxidoreductase [Marinobacterium mangrovicola]|uniref:NADPH:quinone reductase-like Zn-dependent oxidoreductase n=1 Tax=Marinobacterium mangrovicola TaxID=1476959 RepID=A0A4R1GJP4_9GAMM|nr:NADP-dependent oxidoreductase [Marinobacterium mangrovicola]TCK08524.1 NADPH:quinone reductase-like Zn-dependent oxidoreductase [Marinobacterium mangrovicola]
MTRMMNAIRQHQFGGPQVLTYEQAPLPELNPGEVRIRVHAIGINPPDWYLREGFKDLPPEWQPTVKFPLILGSDVSGVIEAIAEDVEGFTIGDEVYAMVRFPEGMLGDSSGYAEYVTAPALEVALKPARIDHLQAAAAPMSLLTAWQFLIEQGHTAANPFQSQPHQPVPLKGKRVLINGAAGGVGHYAVQLAKWQGAHVIAVASSRHQNLLHELGADEVVDYTQTNVGERFSDLDLVMDTVGGQHAERFLQTLKPAGALFLAYPLGFDAYAKAEARNITVSATQVRSHGGQLQTLAGLFNDGTIKTVIDSVYPLVEAAAAHERAASGHLQGKIVLRVD